MVPGAESGIPYNDLILQLFFSAIFVDTNIDTSNRSGPRKAPALKFDYGCTPFDRDSCSRLARAKS